MFCSKVTPSASELYIFDIIYELRRHIDVRRIALLHSLKHHLHRQQLDLMHRYISDYRPRLIGSKRDNRDQEDFGIAIYRFLSSKDKN